MARLMAYGSRFRELGQILWIGNICCDVRLRAFEALPRIGLTAYCCSWHLTICSPTSSEQMARDTK